MICKTKLYKFINKDAYYHKDDENTNDIFVYIDEHNFNHIIKWYPEYNEFKFMKGEIMNNLIKI